MDLNINFSLENIEKDETAKKFVQELTKALENYNNQNNLNNNIKLTNQQELEFHKAKAKFLQNFFDKELLNKEKGEVFIVTDKYENDVEYHRYKVTQYKENAEYKYIAFAKELPENIAIGDIVRKKEGKYIYDEEATRYVKEELQKLGARYCK